ncbi:unnamed protein product [Schistosoma margrebowiei]|uniref:Uncharacterized protein n=1 Tax=Schistosoma margrebowiei TaxID=48269 RepID=A0AA84Z4F0_9TREM|nr:unnamed protein product [Schistosoma margrebowiei]
MSKKKGDVPKKAVLLGRIGTNLKCGVVGLPNVGQVPAENFPFCTINPNESRVAVPDERFDWLCEYHQPVRWVSYVLQLT